MKAACMGLLLSCLLLAEAAADDRVPEAAGAYIVSRFNLDPNAVSVTIRENRSFDDLEPTDSLVAYSRSTSPPRGNYPMKFDIVRDGAIVKTVSASVQVSLWMNAYVASKRIARGLPLDRSDLFVERRDVTRIFDKVLPLTASLASVRAAKVINAGSVIEADMIEPIPDVLRGDEVVIKCNLGAMEIRTIGTAREDGLRGDEIEVMNKSTRKRITAEVESPGVVTVLR